MRTVHWIDPEILPEFSSPFSPTCLAMGVFDGVHRGHERLLQRVVEDANRMEHGIPAVLTFDPNPATIISPDSFPGVLSTLPDRLNRFMELGIRETIVVTFSRRFSVIPGSEFLEKIVRVLPRLRFMVAGFNFHLGHNRDTGPAELVAWLAERDIRVDILGALKDNDVSISSSRIRRAVAAGDLELASGLLGRPYSISVASGDPDGTLPEQLLPPPGVYTCTLVAEGLRREGMMEISGEGYLRWEPRITQIHNVIPRSFIRCR